jgi:hypothetical protein
MELDWSVDDEGEASLVGVRVRNDGAVPRRVRIESRLDGPVLPPRRGGVPEAGWDADGVTAVIESGERRAFGFAALADPVDPPVEIVNAEPVTRDADDGRVAGGTGPAVEPGPAIGSKSATESDPATGADPDLARAAVRDLGSHRPPRRAVAGAEAAEGDVGQPGDETGEPHEPESVDSDSDATVGDENGTSGDTDKRTEAESPPSATDPDEIDAWFAAVEERIERAERLTDADLAGATAAVEAAGGLDAVEGLDERVAADAERLRAVSDRAAALADRADEADVPTEALEALA